VLTIVLTAGGCSGGGTPEASPSAPSPTRAAWRAGEVRPVTGLCPAISSEVLRRLRVEFFRDCMWRQNARDDDDHVERALTVNSTVYQPAMTQSRLSATDEARRGYQVPPRDWAPLGPFVAVRGLGDEARLIRTYNPGVQQRRVVLAVRWRNVVLQIDVDESSPLEWNRGRVPPVGDVEAGAVGAARDMLTRVGAPTPPAAPAPAYQPDEVRAVRKVCDVAAPAAVRLAPGVTRHDITLPGKVLGSGCNWGENDGELPSLTVEAEVIAPSPATGESATQIATTLFGQWRGHRARAQKPGDEAKIDHFTFKSGLSRSSSIFVRRGNLLVYVDYGRWHYPSREAMDKEVIALAQAVLARD
jgi:hypothetical protein